MKIYRPDIRATRAQSSLIEYLKLLLNEPSAPYTSAINRPNSRTHLTQDELAKLQEMLNAVRNERKTIEASYIVEHIFVGYPALDKHLKKIWTRNRSETGRSSAMSTARWEDVKLRLGAIPYSHSPASSSPMPFRHFLRMEEVLFANHGINTAIAGELLQKIGSLHDQIEDVRLRANRGEGRQNAEKYKPIEVLALDRERLSASDGWQTTRDQFSAILTIVVNSTVFFTTRDWGATGVLSMLAGNLIKLRAN